MRWTPGKYAYRREPDDAWKLATCRQDSYTGVLTVSLQGSNARISVNRPGWFRGYEWRGPVERKADAESAPVFVPPGTV